MRRMKAYSTKICIHAAQARIWALLTDATQYPRWNSTVEKVDGTIQSGGKITVHARPDPSRAFPLRVIEFVSPTRMVWSGGMPLGMFTGERTFQLDTQADGSILFSMREIYSGWMASLMIRLVPDLQPTFDQFARDLKRTAEEG
jgi:hypothetical protein